MQWKLCELSLSNTPRNLHTTTHSSTLHMYHLTYLSPSQDPPELHRPLVFEGAHAVPAYSSYMRDAQYLKFQVRSLYCSVIEANTQQPHLGAPIVAVEGVSALKVDAAVRQPLQQLLHRGSDRESVLWR